MTNRLADTLSPYLRQHADNPVDWYPWGAQAFAEAQRRDVPVLVSIGYSTCHWCHVMARESFSDEATAAQLNAGFVAVKIDREEHPEVDAAFMAAASAFTRNLGWPLTVFTTPDGRTFYAGTYWPETPRGGLPSFRDVLTAVQEAWTQRREQVLSSADAVAEALLSAAASGVSELPDRATLRAAADVVAAREDTLFGGFGGAPKFPVAPTLRFLQAVGRDDVAQRALAGMSGSELRDADGGFFRYATQRDWTVPHYERMLTDNAQLLEVALAADAPEVARGIAEFLLTTLSREGGAFAAAQDSESWIDGERSEGGYYRRALADRAGLAARSRRQGAHRLERLGDRRACPSGCGARRTRLDHRRRGGRPRGSRHESRRRGSPGPFIARRHRLPGGGNARRHRTLRRRPARACRRDRRRLLGDHRPRGARHTGAG